MSTRNERIAEIEAVFRAGNERMNEWPENRERARRGKPLVFFCECGRRSCRAHVRLSGSQYEKVRADARLFVVAPGHEIPEAENVVETNHGYKVVLKHEDLWDVVFRLNVRAGNDPAKPSRDGGAGR